MKLEDAKAMARGLFEKYGLTDWTFGFDRAKTRNGQCRYDQKRITLSVYMVATAEDWSIRDCLLHEIAHALAPRGAGHGPSWRATAERIGATPSRCNNRGVMPARDKIGHCGGCGKEFRAHRRANTACRDCCVKFNHGRYDLRFKIQWK